MTTEIEILLLVLSAVAGAAVASALGWSESTESFNAKKFASSLIRGAVGAVILVLGYQYVVAIEPWDYILVFFGGAGFEVTVKRAQGAITKSS